MARKPRIHFPSAVYHVILRGIAGDQIFFSDQDRYRLYLIFQYAVERFGCRIHAFHSGTSEGRILGSDSFTDEILSMVGQKGDQEYSLSEVIAKVCTHYHISEELLKTAGKARPMTEARAIAAAIVQTAHHLRLTELAMLLGRDISALGKAAQRIAGDVNARQLVSELVASMQIEGYKCPKL